MVLEILAWMTVTGSKQTRRQMGSNSIRCIASRKFITFNFLKMRVINFVHAVQLSECVLGGTAWWSISVRRGHLQPEALALNECIL